MGWSPELREHEVRAVLEALPRPTFVLRRSGDELLVVGHNAAASRLAAHLPALLGLTVEELAVRQPSLARDAWAAARSEATVTREVRVSAGGEERPYRLRATPLGEDLLLVQADDLTETHAAQALAETVVTALEDGLIAVDGRGEVILANESAARIAGIALADLYAGRPWWDAFDVARERLAALTAGDDIRDLVVRVCAPGREGRWVSLSTQRLDDEGHIVSFRDVTRRRRAEERFEHAFEDAPIGMALLRLDGAYERVNAALAELLGRSRAAVEQLGWLDVIHPDDRPEAEEALRAARDGTEPQQRFAHRMGRPGAWSSVEKTMSLVRGPDGAPEYLVCQIVDVSDRESYEHELEHRALHDPLTGLPNRALFGDRLEHALGRMQRTGEGVGVAFLDLDSFKRVNDSLGHGAGDVVLCETAERLSGVMRADDTICRFGGDEFIVLCEGLDPLVARTGLVELGDRMLAEIERAPFRIGDHEVVLSGSVGIAVAVPGEEMSAERIVAESDAAMYRAKRRGAGRVELARDETAVATRRLALEGELREALRRGGQGLWLAYQPIIDLAGSARIVGLEALLRWDRPAGPVMPDELVPVAEESGVIVELGEWVLRRAVADLAAWPGENPPYVAVNLGAGQFSDPRLVARLGPVLHEHGFDPGRLSIEITESVAMADAEAALQTMLALKDVGVRIAIDDFGTGFSSLGYLKRFPADTVKIDREFIGEVARPSEDRAIVSAVMSMAGALELDVVAEGVETEDQRAALTDLGCRRAQGFLFARPAPLASALAYAG